MIAVMMTWQNAESSFYRHGHPIRLEAYRLNLHAACSMKQVDSKFAVCDGYETPFETPLVRVDFPGEESPAAYVSGTLDDIESRWRAFLQSAGRV